MNGASWCQASTQDFIQSYSRFSLGNLDLIDSIPEDFEFKKLTEKAASDNQTKGYFFYVSVNQAFFKTSLGTLGRRTAPASPIFFVKMPQKPRHFFNITCLRNLELIPGG